MDSNNIQQSWQSQPAPKGLVLELFKQVQHQKIDAKLNKTKFGTVLFSLYNMVIILWAISTASTNLNNTSILIGNIVLAILSFVIFYKNFMQLSTLSKLDEAMPITHFQKLITHIKLDRVKHNRFMFITCIFYFWSLLITLLEWNILSSVIALWNKSPLTVLAHLILAIAWIPISLWILRQYDRSTGNRVWENFAGNSMLMDAQVNLSFNEAFEYLEEIERFKDEVRS